MNTASEPYRTALLMTKSIPYSRYFRIATATATHRHRNATSVSSPVNSRFVRNQGAAMNHFSCSRSSPEDRANLTTTAAALTTSAATMRLYAAITSGGLYDCRKVLNGSRQTRNASTTWSAAASVNAPATNHVASCHGRERGRPVGKSTSTSANMANGTTQIQLASHTAARPAGRDPGATTRARSPYSAEKLFSPSARPAARKSQPIRFPGRREARTKPTTGTARYVTCPRTPEKSQPDRSAGTRCRFR